MEEGVKIKIGADTTQAEQAIKRTANSLKQIKPGAAQASTAITSLSRVVSDLPFGFIAVQNNLDQLSQSFGKVSFKGFISALIGPAGLAFALTSISSLITVGIQKYGSFSAMLQAVFGDTSALAGANRDLAKSFQEAEGKAAGEVATITALVSIGRDKNISDKERLEAINKLNDEYDKYLPKLTLENINTQQVTSSIDKLNNSLIRQAKIRGVSDLISKEAQKQAELAQEAFDTIESSTSGIGGLINQALAGTSGRPVQTIIQGQIVSIGKEFEKSEERAKRFNEVLRQLLGEEAAADTLFTPTPKAERKIKERAKKIRDLFAQEINDTSLQSPIIDDFIKNSFDPSKLFGKFKIPQGILDAEIQIGKINQRLKESQERAQATAQAVSDALTPAFDAFFNTLLEGSGNPFQAFGEALKNLIKQLVATIAKAALLSFVLTAISGGGSAVGSFGSRFGATFMKTLGGAFGGVANGGISGTINGIANSGGGRLTAEVSGTALRFVLNKANNTIASGF